SCNPLGSLYNAASTARTGCCSPTPGTPSSRMCPRHSRATTTPVTVSSWRTTALAPSRRRAFREALASSVEGVSSGVKALTCRLPLSIPVCLLAGAWTCGSPQSSGKLVECFGESSHPLVITRVGVDPGGVEQGLKGLWVLPKTLGQSTHDRVR